MTGRIGAQLVVLRCRCAVGVHSSTARQGHCCAIRKRPAGCWSPAQTMLWPASLDLFRRHGFERAALVGRVCESVQDAAPRVIVES